MDPVKLHPNEPESAMIGGSTNTTDAGSPSTGYGTVNSLTDIDYGSETGYPLGLQAGTGNYRQGTNNITQRLAANKKVLWVVGAGLLGLLASRLIRRSKMAAGLSEIMAGRRLIAKGQDLIESGRARMSWRQMDASMEGDD